MKNSGLHRTHCECGKQVGKNYVGGQLVCPSCYYIDGELRLKVQRETTRRAALREQYQRNQDRILLGLK